MTISKYILLLITLTILACKQNSSENLESTSINSPLASEKKLNKIPILNFGTFHFGYTSDANSTEFDEHDKDNLMQAHKIAEKLAEFKPTVIIVENLPERNGELQEEYKKYLANPKMKFSKPTEIEMVAYEVGRKSGASRIYGIDHRMPVNYNYNIGNEIVNLIDSTMHDNYYGNLLSYYPTNFLSQDSLNLLEKLKISNAEKYLDFMIAVNADMLTHVGSQNGFEGADEAAILYQRNLRMYSNLNRISFNKNDRIFILMGSSHTAFFRDFISRSPKYEMVNTFDYL